MKHTHTCTKCGSRDVIRVNGEAGSYGRGNNIMIGMTNFSAVKVNRYICCSCGFCEEWIDPEDLVRLRSSGKAIQL